MIKLPLSLHMGREGYLCVAKGDLHHAYACSVCNTGAFQFLHAYMHLVIEGYLEGKSHGTTMKYTTHCL